MLRPHPWCLGAVVCCLTACDPEANTLPPAPDAGLDAGPLVFGLDSRPSNPTCLARERPGPQGGTLTTEALFAASTPPYVTDLKRLSGAVGAWIGITQLGGLFAVADGGAVQTIAGASFFDGLLAGDEYGLLGLAIDPHYPNAERPSLVRLFVNYTATCPGGGACSYLKRINVAFTGSGASVDFADLTGTTCAAVPASDPEQANSCATLMQVAQPDSNHNGGALQFGEDGFLYMTFGDGGGCGSCRCDPQNLGTPLGKLLRLDVHGGDPYAIPASNPYAGASLCAVHASDADANTPDTSRDAPCPEIVATGLRNPFRFTVDRAPGGHLWIGDVGQNAWEEVDSFDPLSSAVPNYGWPLYEATDPLPTDCDAVARPGLYAGDTYEPPRFYYGRTDVAGRGVLVGGHVYRGAALGADFQGDYFTGDMQTGELWVVDDPYSLSSVELGITADPRWRYYDQGMAAGPGFAEDEDGEQVVLLWTGPARFVLAGSTPSSFPTLLSQTGCVDPANPALPASGLIPYAVRSALWSDGAAKERYMALPDGTTIARNANCDGLTPARCEEQGDLELPVGSVLVKVFRVGGAPVETRLLMRHDDGGWGGYTYVWREDLSDADLVQSQTALGHVDWIAPSRAQCQQCHTLAAGGSLGPELPQLNGPLLYPSGVVANQLETLDHIGVFDAPLTDRWTAYPRMPDPADEAAPMAQRARAYLHANCANCHRPFGTTGSSMDLRYATPFAETGLCDAAPVAFWGADVRLLVPGDPSRSLVSMRLHAVDGTAMPPVGRRAVDPVGTAIVDAWITGLFECP